jgi:hypothetical protein
MSKSGTRLWYGAAASLLAAAGHLGSTEARAQEPTGTTWSAEFFVDVYYAGDGNDPAGGRRPDFLFNHTDTDELQLNLGLISLSASNHRIRGSLGLRAGSYVEENLAQEPDWAQPFFEANIGFALDRKGSLWLDLGILPSHIGFESAISRENPTLTRSLAAENSPYYLTGARLNWDISPQWSFATLLVTGWQRTEPVDGNSIPSVGTQLVYTPSDTFRLNWSTFIGTDDPDDERRMRYFSNLYAQATLTPGLDLTVGLDLGVQQATRNASSYDAWMSPVMILTQELSRTWSTAMRAEYYRDRNQVIVNTPEDRGISTWGVSWNVDWQASPNLLCRLEARYLKDQSRIFEADDGRFRDDNTGLLASVSVKF